MPTPDTASAVSTPFYQWDTIPWQHEEVEVNTGIPIDSIFKPRELSDTLLRQSLFSPTALQPQHSVLEPRPHTGVPSWMFLLLTALCALTYLYYYMRKIKLRELPSALFDHRAMDRIVRNNNLGPFRMAPMGLMAVTTLCCAAHQSLVPDSGFGVLALAVAAVAVFYSLRWALLRVIGNVFYSSDAVGAYITSSYFYHLAYATAMLPLLFLLLSLPWGNNVVLYVIAGLTILSFLLRTARGLKVFLTFSKSFSFYLFFYLCTVELVPAIVAAKWIFTL